MANIWHDINPKRITPEDFIAVIEIPKGSKKKYELDKETGLIILDRVLFTSGYLSILMNWARRGFDVPPEIMAKKFERLMHVPLLFDLEQA